VGYLGWQASVRTIEIAWLHRAEKSMRADETVAALKKAFDIQPRNFESACKIGETLRHQSWEGHENYQPLASEAFAWFRRASHLNPYDPHSLIGAGMCLDWLKEHQAAKACFDQALRSDPNGYHTLAHVGWHYVQIHDYVAARKWFERSLTVRPSQNPVARNYLAIADERLAEAAPQN
jgi:tetratricopeptide (TPR) repeat protein